MTLIERHQAIKWAMRHPQGYSMVEFDHGRWCELGESAIQCGDLCPVSLLRAGRLGVECADGGLQLIGARAVSGQRPFQQRQPFFDLSTFPPCPVLLVEQDDLALRIDTGGAA